MDDRTFDARVRALAGSANRRTVIGAIAGVLMGGTALDADAKRRRKCRKDSPQGQCCRNDGSCTCSNGGAVCGERCCQQGERCDNGACITDAGLECRVLGAACKATGRSCCEGLVCGSGQGGQQDVACHVPAGGACGQTSDCVFGTSCVDGACVADRQPEPPPPCDRECCSDRDCETGYVCSAEQTCTCASDCCTDAVCTGTTDTCTQGACTCGGDAACSGTDICCGGTCRSLNTDGDNCGACGNVCDGTDVCCDGTCRSLDTDRTNCGACGNTCQDGDACCGGACKSLNTDANNCGACGAVCTGTDVCRRGACDPACAKPNPASSFYFTCDAILETCTPDGTILTATCRKQDQTPNSTSINVNDCKSTDYRMSNWNGVLYCSQY